MKSFYAWSMEHEGRFWKYNDLGYTTFLELARKFTEKEVLEKQQDYPPNFLLMGRVGEVFIIPDCNEVAILVDDTEALGFAKQHSIRKLNHIYQRLAEAGQLISKDIQILSAK